MRTPVLLFLIAAGAASTETFARAQGPPQAPRIGILAANPSGQRNESFRLRLRELGYVEGQTVFFEHRSARARPDLLPDLAAELVRLKVSVIVAGGPTATDAAMKATRVIPIVAVGTGNPLERGFIKSLSAPGGNVTGLSSFARGLHRKQMELLKEAFPSISRVAVLNSRTRKGYIEVHRRAGRTLGVRVESVDVHNAEQLEKAFAKLTMIRPDALMVARDALTNRHVGPIAAFALRERLPSMYDSRRFVTAGGLMSYGVNTRAQWKRAAVFVDKILRGANPATLPVEPPQFEFVINLQTARKIGRTIPPEILLEANEVIK